MIYWVMNLWVLELIKNTISVSVSVDKLIITLNRYFKEDQRIVLAQDDTIQNPLVLSSVKASAGGEMNPGASGELELSPFIAIGQLGVYSCHVQTNAFDNIEVDRKGAPTKDQLQCCIRPEEF
ncbi:unnamed protein product [Vicia faba]|uniref:Uncharacterized protein n=1 Tax=Vicia faba TaxID=3906 RepID=A0AAV1B151_VICFA|nr:unnamed protein product [Vicia faba]